MCNGCSCWLIYDPAMDFSAYSKPNVYQTGVLNFNISQMPAKPWGRSENSGVDLSRMARWNYSEVTQRFLTTSTVYCTYSRYNEKSWSNPVAKFQFSSVFHYFWGGCNPSCLKTWNPAASAADFVACRCVSLACPGTVSTQPNCKRLWAHLIICSVDLCGTEAETWSDMIWQTDTNGERPRNQKKMWHKEHSRFSQSKQFSIQPKAHNGTGVSKLLQTSLL